MRIHRDRKRKLNNVGFSLVEVLVTMAIIAIVSVPIIRSFVVSANINRNAKRVQSATDTAQTVSESFSTVKLTSLVNKYTTIGETFNSYCGEYYKDPVTGIMVFKNVGDGTSLLNKIPYYPGADTEKFYVTVVLDPTQYKDSVNSYVMPNVADIFRTGNITAFKQFNRYDDRIKTLFGYEGVTVNNYDELIKSSVVTVTETAGKDNSTDYTVTLSVTYTDKTNRAKPKVFDFTLGSGNVASTQDMKPIYLLYTSYTDKNEDKLNIEFVNCTKTVKLYLIDQQTPNALKASQISVNDNKGLSTFYSNVDGMNLNKITTGTTGLMTLYSVDVYIRYNEPDINTVESYTDGTYTTDNVYTSMSTIKEE